MYLTRRSPQVFRFGPFAANLRSGELYKNGTRIRLQEQPFKILVMLLARPGDVVTRDELRQKLWAEDVFVDFDHSINAAIAKLREALDDSLDEPQFIDTVGRRGYRFLASIEVAYDQNTSPRKVGTSLSVQRAKCHVVGREKEKAALQSAFESVVCINGLLVCVAGEPGIGKTTLVEEFLFSLNASGTPFCLAKGRCSERLAGSEAYLPFLEALDTLVRTDAGVARKFRKLAPTWYAQLFPLSESNPSDARLQEYVRTTTQERVKRELGAFFQSVAKQIPLILFFDDLHWADSSTIDLLAYLATKFDGIRILVIAAYRPSDLFLSQHSFIGLKRHLETHSLCREIEVGLLSSEDTERYVTSEFPKNSFPSELSTVIHIRTEGNPLFMVDLLSDLRGRRVIAQHSRDGHWHLAQPLPDLSRDFPRSALSMVERKIEQLSEREREVLTAAAVQGYDFDSAAVAHALEADNIAVEQILDRLDRVHAFVKRVSEGEVFDGTPSLRYRFVHVLYQNTLDASLTPSRRMVLSAAVAHGLEALHRDRAATIASQLAFLYAAAHEPARASDYFLIAAQKAAQIFANEEVITLARRGIALLSKLPETSGRAQKELDLEVTLMFSLLFTRGYGVQEVQDSVVKAQELCRILGDTTQVFLVLFGLWIYYVTKPELQEARRTAEHMLQIAQNGNDRAPLLVAHATLGVALQHQGALALAHKHLEEGLRYHEPTEHRRYLELYRMEPGINLLEETVRTLWMLGFPDQSRRRSEETLKLARALPSPPSLALALVHAAFLQQHLRQPDKALAMAQECMAVCDEHGVAQERVWVMPASGWALAELGRVEEGIAQIQSALDAQVFTGGELARPQFLGFLGEVHWHLGQLEKGLSAIDGGLTMSKRTGNSYYDAELWRIKGELVKMQGKMADAEDYFQTAIEIARQQSAKSLELRASTSLARMWKSHSKRAEAQQLLSVIYAWFSEGFDTADLRDAQTLLKELS